MEQHFLSCDWGTTNFRLRLVRRDDGAVLHETSDDKGVSDLAKAWGAKQSQDEAARTQFYTDVLRDGVRALEAAAGGTLAGLPVVISGMASSTIGLLELPYAPIPAALDGTGFRTGFLKSLPGFSHPVLLISGLCSEVDVMRGEETQLAGCLTPEMERAEMPLLVIHPGTHAKHMVVERGVLTGFRTFMTGELFKLFSTHGILRDNVTASDFDAAAQEPFGQGVRDAQEAPLLHAAFRVRTNDLFGRFDKGANYQYLSGLLIGTELQTLQDRTERMYLCSGPALHGPYSAALRVLGLHNRVTVFPAEWEEGAVVRGQAKVLARTPGL